MEAAVLVEDRPGGYRFACPGCGHDHYVNTNPANGRPCWQLSGTLARPTLAPSLLMTSGHYVPGYSGTCPCDYNREHPDNPLPPVCCCGICHSFVRDGQIQFLPDSTHHLAGHTVPMPPI